jgi:hypothetical protein
MVLRRVTEHLSKQHWTAVFLDFVVVVVGVFLGIQAANWNESRKERAEERRFYAQILDDLRVDQQSLKWSQKRADTFDVAAEDTLRALLPFVQPWTRDLGLVTGVNSSSIWQRPLSTHFGR